MAWTFSSYWERNGREVNKKRMTYLSIHFPKHYEDDTKIYLKDLLSEREGVTFAFILMKEVLDTQVMSVDGEQVATV